MAKKSSVARNEKRRRMAEQYTQKREALKTVLKDSSSTVEERIEARSELSKLPRNSNPIRVRNRCQITGRPHGVYRKLKISRIALRKLSLEGKIPGMIKSSW